MKSAQLLPSIRDLYYEHPDYFRPEPRELQHVLFSLGYTEDLAVEAGDRRGRRGGAGRLATVEGSMTDREKRDNDRRRRREDEEADERRREERNRRFDELREAWRRHHPSEGEERPRRRGPS